MVDLFAIKSAVDGLKTAHDIAKTAIGLRDAALLQEKVIELNGAILSAQSSALNAQEDQLSMLHRIRQLEEEIRCFEKWETEKQRYRLMRYGDGGLAYVLKKSEAQGEPGHALCATCYENRKKSILQSNGETAIIKRAHVCPICKTALRTGYEDPPEFAE